MTFHGQSSDSEENETELYCTESSQTCRPVRAIQTESSMDTSKKRQEARASTSQSESLDGEPETDCSLRALLRMDSTSLFHAEEETIDVDEVCGQFCNSLDMSEGMVFEKEEMEVPKETNVLKFEDRFDEETIFSPDNDGDTLLHMAAIVHETDLALFFIRKSVSYSDISLKNKLHQTPLHLATLTKQVRIVRALMAAGADMTSRDKDGNTALHIACRDGSLDIVRTLLDPVRYAEILHNNYEIPYQQIPQDFSIANYEGLTCLHLAANYGHIDIVEYLETKGAKLNMVEMKTGRTILHNACISGSLSLVRKLLKYRKCNINARTYDGLTPFDLARYKKDDTICMVLAAAGARYGDDEIDSD